MADFNAWASDNNGTLDASFQARRAWILIQRNATSIVIERGSTTLDAQTVRVEHKSNISEVGDANKNARAYQISVVVFGVAGHPTVTATDIKSGDEFGISGKRYRVLDVIPYPGQVQARCYRV